MALTKVTGQVINSTTDLSVGVATVGGGTSTGDLYVVGVTTFASDVSIGGTLTYEDVTNVDSVGLITARKGISVTGVGVTIALGGLNVNAGISTFNDDIKVGSGITLSPDGDSYYTGISTFNDDVKVGSGITLSPDGDSYFTGITTIATKLGIGSVHLGGTATDGLLTIKGDTNVAATPSIRLLDGADAREVSITNTSGDFVASVHGADNTVHGHVKVFESGIVQFANGGASGSITERLRISVDGQVGISSATPDAWHSTYTSLQIHDAAVLYGSTDDSFVGLGANHFLNTSGDFKYSKTDFASRFYQVNGEFVFENVASGTAGNTLSFTERLKIDSDGAMELTPSENTGNDGFTVTPSGGDTASYFKVLGNQSTGAADGRNGGVVNIDANYYVSTSTIFSLAARGTNVYEILGNGNHKIGGTGGTAAVSQTRNLNIGSNSEANLAIETHNDATSESSNIRFYKSGNTAASPQICETDDMIAQLMAYGHDGTDYANQAAGIKFKVDGACGSNNIPGELSFWTSAGSGLSPYNRLNISSKGNIGWGGNSDSSTAVQQRKRFATISHSANTTYDVNICEDFSNNDVLKLEYAYCWNDGDGGAWGTAIAWKHHDGNVEIRYLGEEVASPITSFSLVVSSDTVKARVTYGNSGMNGERMLNVECGGQCTPHDF